MVQSEKRYIWVTIDTEMDADVHWRKKWPPQYTSVCEGIPRFLRPIWDQYLVHPIYFVSPEILYSEECCKVLKEEIRQGAVIGAHLHPEYIEPYSYWGEDIGQMEPQFPHNAYSTEDEFDKIKCLTELIEEKLNVKPVWYRAARFGADLDTIHSLAKIGYHYDSSVTPHIDWTGKGGPDHSRAPESRYRIAKDDLYQSGDSKVIEIPITVGKKRFGLAGRLFPNHWLFFEWLRPTHMTYLEMKHMVKRMHERTEMVMMFHSMEIMVKKTPYVKNRWMQKYFLWRLKKILGYCHKLGYYF